MSEQKKDYPSAGSTDTAQHGNKSANNSTLGSEPPAMLLAILNSALMSMTNSQQAKIAGSALIRGRRATIILIYDALPTESGLVMVEGK